MSFYTFFILLLSSINLLHSQAPAGEANNIILSEPMKLIEALSSYQNELYVLFCQKYSKLMGEFKKVEEIFKGLNKSATFITFRINDENEEAAKEIFAFKNYPVVVKYNQDKTKEFLIYEPNTAFNLRVQCFPAEIRAHEILQEMEEDSKEYRVAFEVLIGREEMGDEAMENIEKKLREVYDLDSMNVGVSWHQLRPAKKPTEKKPTENSTKLLSGQVRQYVLEYYDLADAREEDDQHSTLLVFFGGKLERACHGMTEESLVTTIASILQNNEQQLEIQSQYREENPEDLEDNLVAAAGRRFSLRARKTIEKVENKKSAAATANKMILNEPIKLLRALSSYQNEMYVLFCQKYNKLVDEFKKVEEIFKYLNKNATFITFLANHDNAEAVKQIFAFKNYPAVVKYNQDKTKQFLKYEPNKTFNLKVQCFPAESRAHQILEEIEEHSKQYSVAFEVLIGHEEMSTRLINNITEDVKEIFDLDSMNVGVLEHLLRPSKRHTGYATKFFSGQIKQYVMQYYDLADAREEDDQHSTLLVFYKGNFDICYRVTGKNLVITIASILKEKFPNAPISKFRSEDWEKNTNVIKKIDRRDLHKGKGAMSEEAAESISEKRRKKSKTAAGATGTSLQNQEESSNRYGEKDKDSKSDNLDQQKSVQGGDLNSPQRMMVTRSRNKKASKQN